MIASAVRQTLRRRNHPDFTYTPKQLEEGRRRWKVGSRILTYVTFAMLILGFIWCLYFLVLALADPDAGRVCQQFVGNDRRAVDDHLDRFRVLRVSAAWTIKDAAWTIKDKANRQFAGALEKDDRFPEFIASSGNQSETASQNRRVNPRWQKYSSWTAHLTNMIAAGEVVERPMGVIKELVENALDAQATRIEVNINQGGTELMEVIDNGVGMDREDACLCFERHATSKIKTTEDLWAIHTLGFRGEALPSIASVSNPDTFDQQRRRFHACGNPLRPAPVRAALPLQSGNADHGQRPVSENTGPAEASQVDSV